MLTRDELETLARHFLDAWNSQDVEAVLACYTTDLVYRDPNTRASVIGSDSMRRYLTKLFATWSMTWSLREAHAFRDSDGAAILWHATFSRTGQKSRVEADGMDFIALRGRLAYRNEVYFDRAVLSEV
ncbi:MAG TPA: nuclear transport factor 2 family protein [Thermodesulfobacteriota bacterium]|nr:nuclear transport factor 2 family protein [Thermodesulfobacteriota bacterium]